MKKKAAFTLNLFITSSIRLIRQKGIMVLELLIIALSVVFV